MAKKKVSELDPCLPRPQDVMPPAELKAWVRRMKAEKEDAQKSSEKD